MWVWLLTGLASATPLAVLGESPVALSETLPRGPLEAWSGAELGDSRMVGMGGAYLAVADTGGATLENPASLAVRRPLRADQPLQLDGTLVATGLNVSSTPFQPTELGGPDPNLLAHAGGVLKAGPLGVGAHVVRFGYAWPSGPSPSYARLQHGLVAVGGAWAFGGGAVVLGGLLQGHYAAVTVGEDPALNRSFQGLSLGPGGTIGALAAPSDTHWRVGGRLRAPSRARPLHGEGPEVHWPAQAAVGVAWSTVPNSPATYGRGEAPDRAGRYLLLTTDIEVTGPSDGAALQALSGEPADGGAPTTVSVQVGAESEVIERRLTLRAGGYNEPGRHGPPKLHATGGLAVFLGEWPRGNGIRVSTGVDVAEDWLRIAFGIGAW